MTRDQVERMQNWLRDRWFLRSVPHPPHLAQEVMVEFDLDCQTATMVEQLRRPGESFEAATIRLTELGLKHVVAAAVGLPELQ